MNRWTLFVCWMLLSVGCTESPAAGSKAGGEACAATSECAGDLRCISGACADLDAVSQDAESDAEAIPESFYRLKVTTQLGEEHEIIRDISGKADAFSFGSTHISPAVSFAVSEDFSWPATMTLTFNFGIVVGSDAYPVQTDATGVYPFSAGPPEVDVILGLRYRSTVEGSTGSVTITEYGNQTGGVVAGSFEGRLLQSTTKLDKKWADVEGEFRFLLPEKEQGQPN